MIRIALSVHAAEDGEADALSLPWTASSPYRRREIIQGANEEVGVARPMPHGARVILIDAIRQAHRWLGNLVSNPNETVEAIASREGKTERSIRMTLSLAFLAPDIVKAAIDGRLPRGFGLKRWSIFRCPGQTNGGCWVSERRRVPKRRLPNYFGRKALPQQTYLERDRRWSCVWRAWPPRTPCLNQHPGKRKLAA